MVKRKRRGPISKAVRNLCSSTFLELVNKPEFKKGLRKSIDEYPSALGNIGMAIQGWVREHPDKKDEIWQLVDEVEPRIREQFEKRANSYLREA